MIFRGKAIVPTRINRPAGGIILQKGESCSEVLLFAELCVYLHSRCVGPAPQGAGKAGRGRGLWEDGRVRVCRFSRRRVRSASRYLPLPRNGYIVGLMAEWLGKGLQNLVQRFESASDLTKTALQISVTLFSFCFVIHL